MAQLLLIGFDSAWTAHNRGAIVAAFRDESGTWSTASQSEPASFDEAQSRIIEWQRKYKPTKTFILIDQPTIVRNPSRQRPVEHIVSSSIGLRFGGMQPANTSKTDMFGPTAPIWAFLEAFGNITDPWHTGWKTVVLETYPALALIALNWLIYDVHAKDRPSGRLPKYNPALKMVSFRSDWDLVCTRVAAELRQRHIPQLATYTDELRILPKPRKLDQDKLDALICLLVGMHFVSDDGCCVIGTTQEGLILTPKSEALCKELSARCIRTMRDPAIWVRHAKG